MDERADHRPNVSVIICTRDRGDALLPTVYSILADAPIDSTVELLVIDQSDGDSVRQALAVIDDDRLHYHYEPTRGLSAARNAGLRASAGALVAFTDDDCVVEPGWLAAIVAAFAARPDVGVVFGHVACAEHDSTQGYLPGFRASEGLLTRRRMLAGAGHWGMGANMALRRSACERIGPFDERLGAGAVMKSAEDVDYALRAHLRGIGVYHAAGARVVHHGFRPWTQASALMRGASSGIGAMYAKHVRAGHAFALVLWLSDLRGRSFDVARNAILLRRPLGANALIYQLSGFSRGWRMPVARATNTTGLIFS
ncbi:MAG TPA: glycosyltransferase [Ktedonobacterales bacterium]|nr:glycosyltransferase [Ktedonobacterales bacterium]